MGERVVFGSHQLKLMHSSDDCQFKDCHSPTIINRYEQVLNLLNGSILVNWWALGGCDKLGGRAAAPVFADLDGDNCSDQVIYRSG